MQSVPHRPAAWRLSASLPLNPEPGWSLWAGNRLKARGFAACLQAAAHWDPIAGQLVGQPQRARLQPLADVPELSAVASRRYGRRLAALAWITGLFALAYLAIALTHPHASDLLPIACTGAILWAVFVAEYVLHRIQPRAIVDRSRLIAWLQQDRGARRAMLSFGAVLFASWLLQLGIDRAMQDDDGAVRAYGVLHSAVRAGQWWRLLSGPFIHSGLAHMISNLAVGLIAMPIVAALWGGRWAVAVFTLGNVAAMAGEAAWSTHDAATGVSGGVYAAYAMIIAMALFRPGELPRGGWLPIAGVLLVALPFGAMQGVHVAQYAHGFGFTAGVLVAAANAVRLRHADRHFAALGDSPVAASPPEDDALPTTRPECRELDIG